MGRGGDGIERGDGAQAPEARTGGGGEEVGRRMGQGGQKDRLARAYAAARVGGSTPQVGGREDLFLALSEQEDEQRLREALRQRGGVRLRGHDPFDGEAPEPCLRISKQFLEGVFSEV